MAGAHPESGRQEPRGSPLPTDDRQLEAFAVQLARAAGRQVLSAMRRPVSYGFKHAAGRTDDPVSEMDLLVEEDLRRAVAAAFPDHGFLGEELGEKDGSGGTDGIVWAVDPIDGTSNFLHHFPLFAVSLGCLRGGVPVAGAVWCASSHALRPGVYHARANGRLCFDGVPLRDRGSGQPMLRPLFGAARPDDASRQAMVAGWDRRTTGSAAVDCTFVAAGILRCARLAPMSVWDVAGSIALLRAAGKEVRVAAGGHWVPFERFTEPWSGWRRALLVGDADGLGLLTAAAQSCENR